MIYLSVTVLSIGVLVAVRHEFPRVSDSLELTVLGVIIGMFTVTSLLHWYDVNRAKSTTQFTKRRP